MIDISDVIAKYHNNDFYSITVNNLKECPRCNKPLKAERNSAILPEKKVYYYNIFCENKKEKNDCFSLFMYTTCLSLRYNDELYEINNIRRNNIVASIMELCRNYSGQELKCKINSYMRMHLIFQ